MKSKFYFRSVLLLVFSLFLLNPVFSQTKVSIQGFVKDDKGGVLPGASITVQGSNKGP